MATQALSKTKAAQDTGKRPEGESRWAQVAEYFKSEQAGHLTGKSDEALTYVRDFRKDFDL